MRSELKMHVAKALLKLEKNLGTQACRAVYFPRMSHPGMKFAKERAARDQ
jgi:hypothetical protein